MFVSDHTFGWNCEIVWVHLGEVVFVFGSDNTISLVETSCCRATLVSTFDSLALLSALDRCRADASITITPATLEGRRLT